MTISSINTIELTPMKFNEDSDSFDDNSFQIFNSNNGTPLKNFDKK